MKVIVMAMMILLLTLVVIFQAMYIYTNFHQIQRVEFQYNVKILEQSVLTYSRVFGSRDGLGRLKNILRCNIINNYNDVEAIYGYLEKLRFFDIDAVQLDIEAARKKALFFMDESELHSLEYRAEQCKIQ